MLKGALMLHVWEAPLARATKDLDFLGRLDNSPENLERVVQDVCGADVEPDGMVFDPVTVKAERIKVVPFLERFLLPIVRACEHGESFEQRCPPGGPWTSDV